MSENARKYAEKYFNIELITNQFEDIIDKVNQKE